MIKISKNKHNMIFKDNNIGIYDKCEYILTDNYLQVNKYYNWIFILKQLLCLVFYKFTYVPANNKKYRDRYIKTLFAQKKYRQFYEYRYYKNSKEYEKFVGVINI